MKKIYQDITFNLEVTEMDKETYNKIVAVAKAIGDGQIHTFTYNESGQDDLDHEQRAHIAKLYS